MGCKTNYGEIGANAVSGLADDLVKSALGPLQVFRPMGKFMNGSRAIIKVNGKIAGFAFGVSWNIATIHNEVFELDNFLPYELAPTLLRVSGSLSMFHMPGKGPSNLNMQANRMSFLHQKYVTIQIVDQQTSNIILNVQKAVITNRSQALQAGEQSTIVLDWMAIGWQDDQTPEYAKGYDKKSNEDTGNGIASSGINDLLAGEGAPIPGLV